MRATATPPKYGGSQRQSQMPGHQVTESHWLQLESLRKDAQNWQPE